MLHFPETMLDTVIKGNPPVWGPHMKRTRNRQNAKVDLFSQLLVVGFASEKEVYAIQN